ncbi:hypothetical protein NUH88_08065 [Nisaea acidiphila]|uniref:Uncharacterized protein n=1 Tax=Nisaea acidiphila TaxID=1862145 RepID=A0A9J7AV56_9PROT|nr:hypothetical protein [Nisaea acidiphila]UUX51643.1 hypothetical protein NUH88_08065 [Nisaea acidiphila]
MSLVIPASGRGGQIGGIMLKVLSILSVVVICVSTASCASSSKKIDAGWRSAGAKTAKEKAAAFRIMDKAFACRRAANPDRVGWIKKDVRLFSVDLSARDEKQVSVVGAREPQRAIDRVSWHNARAYVAIRSGLIASEPAAGACRTRDPVGEYIRRRLRRMKDDPIDYLKIEADGLTLGVAHVETRGGRDDCVLIYEEFQRVFDGRDETLTIALADCAPGIGRQGLRRAGLLAAIEKVRFNVEGFLH